MVFALALALVAVAGQLAQSLIPANIPSDVAGQLQRLSARIADYKVKDLYIHTCSAGPDPCKCPPGYHFAQAADVQPITNYGAPGVASRLLCLK